MAKYRNSFHAMNSLQRAHTKLCCPQVEAIVQRNAEGGLLNSGRLPILSFSIQHIN